MGWNQTARDQCLSRTGKPNVWEIGSHQGLDRLGRQGSNNSNRSMKGQPGWDRYCWLPSILSTSGCAQMSVSWPPASLSSLAKQLSGECSRALSSEPADLQLGHNTTALPAADCLPSPFYLVSASSNQLSTTFTLSWVWVLVSMDLGSVAKSCTLPLSFLEPGAPSPIRWHL